MKVPADLATLGVSATQLHSETLWWHFPKWLETLSIPEQPQLRKTDTEWKRSHILRFLRTISETLNQDRFNLNK